ncbi:MAG TPA: STAS domain-containing protein [Actinocrinis sp.]
MSLQPAAAPLNVSTWFDEARAVVEAAGELDVYTSPRLRVALMDLHMAGRCLLVVDMAAVAFMDSSALGVLVGGVKRARDAGGALVLVAPSERILRVLRITGLLRVMPVFETLPEAFAHLDSADKRP